MTETERKATGSFNYGCKTKTGYSMKMTGKVYGPKHGNVIVAALDGQLVDDVNLLDAAPDLLEALKDARFSLYGEGPGNPKIDAALAKATASQA